MSDGVEEQDKAKSLLVPEEVPKMEAEGGKGNPDHDDHKEFTDRNNSVSISVPSVKQLLPDEDDGFRTPTSSVHKIPAIVNCPPAPKKPRPEPGSRLKRKASSPPPPPPPPEIESVFPLIPSRESVEWMKPKKPRIDEDED